VHCAQSIYWLYANMFRRLDLGAPAQSVDSLRRIA
jgi:hypothetical protein